MVYKALVQRAKQASADDRLLTAKEIASILKVHVKTVYEWTGENRLNAYDLGKRSKRYDIEEVLAAVSRKRKDKDEDNQNRERNVCN